jgi:uncharacterized short protein YbdD (DUF466 family)
MSSVDLQRWLRTIAAVVSRVIGAPDYDRYVAHVRVCHPGAEPMTLDEFARERMHSRYDKPGGRCC